MHRLAITCAALFATHPARTQGWNNVGKDDVPKGFSWTDPLFSGFWMAWTPATLAIFIGIFAAMGTLIALEIRWPGGNERQGFLGLTTTRGDRLFISLLGTVYIFLAWLGLVGQGLLWIPLILALSWATLCFWKA
ncbi:DUF2160 domain-containing protein [Actibacterium sp. 188UL27-1]|uniref:DUF2160 domain-containing protein n=1 Tax=Actibacterium sp. 188UL27-1 TaxID=2786961 RepID=UPI00195BC551|nr:DUF2160 domain-containing protein [Actibacterium sp. 188UL27-1]MBM7067172.1 DUF2160 domain-containing protein [Actibacterium sp. 188UL27-1]